MKQAVVILLLILVPMIFSCKKSSPVEITDITIELNKTKILDDGTDRVEIMVYDQDNNIITKNIKVYANQGLLEGSWFLSDNAGTFLIHAEYEDLSSDTHEVIVVEDIGLKFEKNIMIEQFTGTWCGWCPRAIHDIRMLVNSDSHVTHISYHLSDEFSYSHNSTLFNFLEFSGVPSVSADRKVKWEGQISAITSMHIDQRLGIKLSVEGDCSGLDVTVNVKFGMQYTEYLGLAVYLVQDSLVADQSNYYHDDPGSPWFSRGEVLEDFVHEKTMIKIATDLYGNLIPKENIDIGSTYEKSFSIKQIDCDNIDDLKVVALVTYKSGEYAGTVITAFLTLLPR